MLVMRSLQITNTQWDLSHFCGYPSSVLPCFSEAAHLLSWKVIWVYYLYVFLLLVKAEPCSLQGWEGCFLDGRATLKLE